MKPEYASKLRNFKEIFIFFEILSFSFIFFSTLSANIASQTGLFLASDTFLYLAIIMVWLAFGIALLVMTYKVGRILKKEKLMDASAGLLTFLQLILNLSLITSVIIPIFLWQRSLKLTKEEGQEGGSPQRSFGVTLLGWFFILCLPLGLAGFITSGLLYPKSISASMTLSLISLAAWSVCGILVLKQKEIGRKLAFALTIFGVAWAVLTIINPTFSKVYEQGIENNKLNVHESIQKQRAYAEQKYANDKEQLNIYLEQLDQQEKSYNLATQRATKKSFKAMIMLIPSGLFLVFIFYFFTRPKVKEQFSR